MPKSNWHQDQKFDAVEILKKQNWTIYCSKYHKGIRNFDAKDLLNAIPKRHFIFTTS